MKKTFKVLVAANQYVDESRLQMGLYTTSKPMLHDVCETIETIKKRMDEYQNFLSGFDAGKAKNTLDQCELVIVDLNFINPKPADSQ